MISAAMADAIVVGGTRERLTLTVLYDERCPLCRRLKVWLTRQPTLHPVTFLVAGSAEARRRFPHLDHARTIRVLTLVTSDGAVYEGERAWLVCGWALPAWQPVTEGLGGRVRLGLVALVARTADVYRHRLAQPCPECPR
jgi:predicted DCC family thiol-disulfide oxidoreductase YuxK